MTIGAAHDHYRHLRPAERRRLERWRVRESSKHVSFFQAHDGWELALSHYTEPAQVRHRHPVLLCHGLGGNRLAFDIDPEHSLSRWLAAQGFDVYAVDLRGHGLSARPGPSLPRERWGFVEYCELDVPAAIESVLRHTGKESLHFVGHSMGGILLYAHTAIATPRIVSGVAIGSSLDYSGAPSAFHYLTPLAGLTRFLGEVPIHWPALVCANASAGSPRFVDPMRVNPENVEIETYRAMAANGMHPVASRVLRELARAIDGRGMCDSRGRRYVDLLAEKGYPFPILAMAGTADLQCSPHAARRFGTAFMEFGKPHGYLADYGHDDLVIGKNARIEVWPHIARWLVEHD